MAARPGADRYAFLDHPGPIPFVHRATGSGHAENTLPAIESVVGLGYRYVETDVRATSDGVAVLAHDADLLRVAGHTGKVAELPFEALAAVPLGSTSVARLDEVLSSWPDLRLNIDLKDDASVPAVVEVLRRTGALDRVCVTSFTDRRIEAFRRRVGPSVCTGMGARAATALKVASTAPLRSRRPPRAGVAQLPQRMAGLRVIDARLLEHAHARGLAVHAWVVDTRPEIEALLDAGIDGIITDAPSVLREVLLERALWAG